MNKKQKNIAVIVFVVTVVGYIMAQQMMNSNIAISAKDAYSQLQNDTSIVLLDVRTLEEHIGERIGNTPLIPVHELEQRIHELDVYKDRTIIVYCRSGNRSGSATKLLREKGFHALNMLGGIRQWKTEKFPIVSGPIQ
ncbi:MAG TPA: rhodanese-like domain-containing protein [Bacteroidetes bacterium]|nr:rhodanese-like domain-containing protein [Bacteroidota bacterium]